MAKKNNIRSIRFSDEILQIIEAQEGDTFTSKFESLVYHCVQELPQKERELESTNQAIRRNREQLGRMSLKVDAYRRELQSMDRILLELSKKIARAQELEW